MKRTHAQPLGELLQEFYNEHPELRQKILEVRVVRAWGEVLGLSVSKATRSLYVRQGILYVSVDSSVLRNELMLNRAHLVEKLNECAGASDSGDRCPVRRSLPDNFTVGNDACHFPIVWLSRYPIAQLKAESNSDCRSVRLRK